MTRGQQRQLGAVEAEVVTSGELVVTGEGLPAVVAGEPTALAEFDGWEVEDFVKWLKEQGMRTRLAVGLALCALRDRTTDKRYGEIVAAAAEDYGVGASTLWRWRTEAQEHFHITPLKGSGRGVKPSHNAKGQKAVSRQRDTAPELTTGVVSGDEEPLDAPVSPPEAPPPPPEAPAPAEDPAPVPQAPTPSAPTAPKPDAAVVSAVRVLLLPRTVAELKASIRPVDLRDLVDRLAAADGRTAILHAEWHELEKLRAAAASPAVTKPAAPRAVGRPRPIRESPKPSECIHPPNQVRDGFCFGCGKEGVKPGGRRSAS